MEQRGASGGGGDIIPSGLNRIKTSRVRTDDYRSSSGGDDSPVPSGGRGGSGDLLVLPARDGNFCLNCLSLIFNIYNVSSRS